VAKAMGKAFACGASVSDTASGGKEVVIQGDVLDPLAVMLEEKYQVRAWLGGWVGDIDWVTDESTSQTPC
jgi:translation initiation factor 1 (eIF-1/SUI1)